MSVYLSEEEQLENVKKFFSQYGNWFLGLALLILLSVLGYQYWQKSQQNKLLEGFEYTNKILQLAGKIEQNPADKKDLSNLREEVRKYSAKHPKGTYTLQGLLLLAKVESDTGNKAALQTLEKAYNTSASEALENVTKVRYARALTDANQAQKALDILTKATLPAFIPSVEEAKGDAYMALKQDNAAVTAYKLAWDELAKRQESNPMLQLKLNNLGIIVNMPVQQFVKNPQE